jgi:hypothetical protein
VVHGEDACDPLAAAHVHVFRDGFGVFTPERTKHKLAGLAVHSQDLAAAIPFALEREFDFLVLDGTAGIATPWAEITGQPDFSVLRDAIAILRRMNREEDIDLVYFGGVRSGTDAAKLLALGAKAVVLGVSMALALGGVMHAGRIGFHGDRTLDERTDAAASILNASSTEASIMARCTGKTDVRNLEPEDVRSITLATARAFGVPLAGARRGVVPAAAE